jgi:hypothetical protein
MVAETAAGAVGKLRALSAHPRPDVALHAARALLAAALRQAEHAALADRLAALERDLLGETRADPGETGWGLE